MLDGTLPGREDGFGRSRVVEKRGATSHACPRTGIDTQTRPYGSQRPHLIHPPPLPPPPQPSPPPSPLPRCPLPTTALGQHPPPAHPTTEPPPAPKIPHTTALVTLRFSPAPHRPAARVADTQKPHPAARRRVPSPPSTRSGGAVPDVPWWSRQG